MNLRKILLFNRSPKKIRFFIGSQNLYGEKALASVQKNALKIVDFFAKILAVNIEPELIITSESATKAFANAQGDPDTIGVIIWCHTFSPAMMWTNGLRLYSKPLLVLHTQFFKECPWLELNMEYMNLNQTAHGTREFCALLKRMKKSFEIVTGFWQDKSTIQKIKQWIRVCMVISDLQDSNIVRTGDYMNFVSCTPVDPITLQLALGANMNGHPMVELLPYINQITPKEIEELTEWWLNKKFKIRQQTDNRWYESVKYAAQIYLAIKKWVLENNIKGWSYTFHDFGNGVLKDLPCLPGQILSGEGIGIGWEGHGLLAVLGRALAVLNFDLPEIRVGPAEDYTYDQVGEKNMSNLFAHMDGVGLDLCGRSDKFLDVHPLSIGLSKNPARAVFSCEPGWGVHSTIVDRGGHLALITATGKLIEVPKTPNLPIASFLWQGDPYQADSSSFWLLAGGAHHGVTCVAKSREERDSIIQTLAMLARICNMEFIGINEKTTEENLRATLTQNEDHFCFR